MTPAVTARIASARQSILDTFKVDGIPIGDVTAAQANGWADRKVHELRLGAREVRFVRLLTQNLPPSSLIRQRRSAEDAAELFRVATTATLALAN